METKSHMLRNIPRKISVILAVIMGVLIVFFLLNIDTVNRLLFSNELAQSPYTIGSQVQFKNPFEPEPKRERQLAVERAITKLDFIADGELLSLRYDGDRTEVIYKLQKVYKGTAPGDEISVFYNHLIKDSFDKNGEISLIQAYQWPDGNFYAVPQGSSFTDGTNSKFIQQEIRAHFN